MANNVNKVFVQQIYKEISDAVESSKKNPEFWKECISLEDSKTVGSTRPLLQVGQNLILQLCLFIKLYLVCKFRKFCFRALFASERRRKKWLN